MAHWSDCATNSAPAYPPGPCDCGNDAPDPDALEGPLPADSAASLTQQIEEDEEADLDQGEGADRK